MRKRTKILGVLGALAAAVAGTVLATSANAAPAAQEFKLMQLNLCNSGIAPCYEEYNKHSDSVGEAVELIRKYRPNVVTLNEVCAGDTAYIAQATGYVRDSRTFTTVHNKDGAAIKCSRKPDNNGRLASAGKGTDYGVDVLVRNDMGGPTGKPDQGPFTHQKPGEERRVSVCVPYRSFTACTAHLSSKDKNVAMGQCHELEDKLVRYSQRGATVMGGDFNLKYDDGKFDVQKCVHDGFFRKGDGDVQHTIFTARQFAPGHTDTPDMKHSDHDALLVTVTKK